MANISQELKEAALHQLQKDANSIYQLIQLQIGNLTLPQCPFYEEVLDTQMYGLQKEIQFAVNLGLIDAYNGRTILEFLEKELSILLEKKMSMLN